MVQAFYFMHQVHFGSLYGHKRADDQQNASDAETTDDEEPHTAHPRKRRRILQNAEPVPADYLLSSGTGGKLIPVGSPGPGCKGPRGDI